MIVTGGIIMKVFDIMSDHIITVGQSEPVSAAARLLKQYNIGARAHPAVAPRAALPHRSAAQLGRHPHHHQ